MPPKIFITILISLALTSTTAYAQMHTTTSANGSVGANVWDSTGMVDIFVPATSPVKILSAPQHSFLSVLVNGEIYTNNPNLPDSSRQSTRVYPVIALNNGHDTVLYDTTNANDTIRTTWKTWWGLDSSLKVLHYFDIVQEVYPAVFRNGGQIVVSVQIVNHTSNPISAQTQYLLDVDIAGVDDSGFFYLNDTAKIATEYGLAKTCQTFLESDRSTVPPFYLGFEKDLGIVEFPGNVVSGFVNDTFTQYPLGLIEPLTYTIADWPSIATKYTWGWPSSMIGTVFSNEAILIQWPSITTGTPSSRDSVGDIARTCYGKGGFIECLDFVDGFTFYPYVKHNFYYPQQQGYLFPVTSLLFNRTVNDTLKDVKATLVVDTFFKIVAPLPVLDSGLSQTQVVKSYSMPPETMAVVFWTDTIASVSFTDNSTMQVSVTADGLNIHGQIVAAPELSNCSLDILPRRLGDLTPPFIKYLSGDGSFDGSICNARCTNMYTIDSGFEQSGIKSILATSLVNMQQVTAKLNASSVSATFTECIIDSMLDGSATVTVTDFANNLDSVHFTYCTIPDTLAPQIFPDPASKNLVLSIQENRPWDRRIDSISISTETNLNVIINPPNNWKNLSNVHIIATSIDTTIPSELCLEVTDLAGNKTDTCFALAARMPQGGVAMEISQPIQLTVLPNPSEDRFDIQLTSAKGARAEGEILDLLGRTVGRFSFTNSYTFDAHELPAGTYILRISMDGKLFSKRIIKE